MNTKDKLKKRVESTREKYEDLDAVSDLGDSLDIEYRVRHDGTINEIVLCEASGGPGIQVLLRKGVVKGVWSSARFSSPISNESLLDELFEHHRSLFQEMRFQGE
ncbi:hypothetical protein [Halorubrum laminariae]|uniref:Uncharacterized protein n=1 Tax=Halorubrum laminariae TaxID=1433523 RepID=A0ABD6BWV0_9EURY|nr:hypothetical protein [Halorubrum laminariae]